jgi:hypothetical protein
LAGECPGDDDEGVEGEEAACGGGGVVAVGVECGAAEWVERQELGDGAGCLVACRRVQGGGAGVAALFAGRGRRGGLPPVVFLVLGGEAAAPLSFVA